MKDSGKRLEFESGMLRDTTEGKINYMLIKPGPMLKRWAAHLSRAAAKYDNTRKPGEPRNWQLARGMAEFERFQESFLRHAMQWLDGDRDEDHAAAMFFNINGAEYVLEQLAAETFASEMPAAPPFTSCEAEQCGNRGPDDWYCERCAGHVGAHWFPAHRFDPEASPTWPNIG